ncbi:hypothetical protein [Halolamina rubra]|uniref:hypothetical protein n=1 Tax=Halolamina rubra TaxID=1380430 RepID=UPI000678B06B|nr:hypothetical protein [Halolamina rubra]
MRTDGHAQFAPLDAAAFTRLVARTWRSYGWEVVEATPAECPDGIGDVTAPIDGGATLLVRSTEPRVLLTVPGERRLSAATLVEILGEVETPSRLLVAAAAGYETGALHVAETYGVELVEPAALARLNEPAVEGDRPEA